MQETTQTYQVPLVDTKTYKPLDLVHVCQSRIWWYKYASLWSYSELQESQSAHSVTHPVHL